MMEWVPMLDHQMQCSPNSFSGFVFFAKCKTAKMQNCTPQHAPGARLTPCGHIWCVRGCVKPRSALPLENSDDRPLFATCPIVFNVARSRKVINFESNASIHSNSATLSLCLTKCTHLKSSTSYSRRLYLSASYKSLLPRNRETQKSRKSLI